MLNTSLPIHLPRPWWHVLVSFYFAGLGSKASQILGKCSTTELYSPSPDVGFLVMIVGFFVFVFVWVFLI